MTLLKHLIECHGFGLYQCVYCRFGTNTFDIITDHMANDHPSKVPMFCERAEIKNLENRYILPSSIDSTSLKHINQTVASLYLKNAPNNEILLKNEMNKNQIVFNASTSTPPQAKPIMKRSLPTEYAKKVNAAQNARNPPIAVPTANRIVTPSFNYIMPSSTDTEVKRTLPIKTDVVKWPNVNDSVSKPIGLQIKNVFSLSSLRGAPKLPDDEPV